MTSAPSLGTSKRPSDRRTQIRVVACQLFHARGFASVGIDDIAREVGISAPAVYRHYRNKQKLLEAVVDVALATVEGELAAASDLDSALAAFARLGAHNREFGVIIARETVHLEDARAATMERLQRIVGRLAALLAPVRPDLERGPLAVLARGLLAMVIAPSFNPYCDASSEYVAHSRRAMALYCSGAQLSAADLVVQVTDADEISHFRPWLSRPEAILAEAPSLLIERGGYESTTLDDLASAVGMAGASVYTYFSSKAAVFQAAAARSYAWNNADLERALATSHSGEDVMRKALAAFVTLADLFATVAIEPEQTDSAGAVSVVEPHRLRNVELWWECIRAARPDLDPVAQNAVLYALLGLLNALRRGVRNVDLTTDDAKGVEIAMKVLSNF